ncbi:hypothetical protein [Polaribacter aquimarinus]|uniref:Lipoprotein n=1 Tax=Polaribacter aquimarinus TaxID=2100726 RepID=A0A2U2JE03_9FLAO|nr:hypothetical protein [Polaribacter aquimarinus]PWG06567.1 hypothetical protein DIS07_01660 [Polaribacter aquimarinus]
MKNLKTFLTLVFLVVLYSCDDLPNQEEYEKIYFKMPIKEFLKNHPKAKIEFRKNNLTLEIYSIVYKGKDKPSYRGFYYFYKSKLSYTDRGTSAKKDYKINLD